jgi:hypothetical protein
MENYRKVSRTQTNHQKAQDNMKKVEELMKKAQETLKKSTAATELEKHINIALDHLSVEDVQDIIEGIKEEQEADVIGETDNADENFQDVLETESLEVEVKDNAGPIDEDECDEVIDITFSTDGPTASKQMIDKLSGEQELFVSERGDKTYYSVKNTSKNGRELIIENHNLKKKNDFGLITTIQETNTLESVSSWERWGNKKSNRKFYDFKGKNIQETVGMIKIILA